MPITTAGKFTLNIMSIFIILIDFLLRKEIKRFFHKPRFLFQLNLGVF